jgi:hypothetical protein
MVIALKLSLHDQVTYSHAGFADYLHIGIAEPGQ